MTFDELRPVCGYRQGAPLERRPANALALEHFPFFDRCTAQPPDGRGLAWLLSGGSILAYGHCDRASCPLALPERAHETL